MYNLIGFDSEEKTHFKKCEGARQVSFAHAEVWEKVVKIWDQ